MRHLPTLHEVQAYDLTRDGSRVVLFSLPFSKGTDDVAPSQLCHATLVVDPRDSDSPALLFTSHSHAKYPHMLVSASHLKCYVATPTFFIKDAP